jgi:two-component system OmpR family response regulator
MTKVLLIESDRKLARTYIIGLQKYGHETSWVQSAQAAISAAEQFEPELIVLDPQIAGHNGVEFLYELRSYEDMQEVPVILMSGIMQSQLGVSSELCTQLGVVAVLYKPQTSLEQLGKVIASQLSRV